MESVWATAIFDIIRSYIFILIKKCFMGETILYKKCFPIYVMIR